MVVALEIGQLFYKMDVKILAQEYISKHPYFTARKDRYQLASGKIVDPYYVVEIPDSIVVMTMTKNNDVLFVRQYRHPAQQEMLELPGGFIDPNEDPKIATARELREETGFSFEQIHYLGRTMANPGVLTGACHMFLVTGAEKTSEQDLDDNEEILVELHPLKNVPEFLREGKILQSMHALCLFYGLKFIEENQLAPIK